MKFVFLLLLPVFCTSAVISFLQVTDIHYDPTYNPFERPGSNCNGNASVGTEFPYGQYGCDSPALLVQSMMDNIQELMVTPKFVLMTGDNAGHDVSGDDQTLAAFGDPITRLQRALPGVPIYQVIGNNDLSPKNTLQDTNSAYLSKIETKLQSLMSFPESVWSTFSQGGYYSHSPIEGLRVVVMNTIYYFTNVSPQPANSNDPAGQFAWLSQVLRQAAQSNESVLINFHMGVGGSRSSNVIWKSSYVRTFVNLIQPYSSIITAILEGHTHRDLFNLIYPLGSTTNVTHQEPSEAPFAFSLNSGSLVTSSYNNPSYRIYYLDADSMELVDFVQMAFDFDTEEWTSYYRFSDLTGEKPTTAGLLNVYRNLQSGSWPEGNSTKSMCNYISSIWATNSTHIWEDASQYVSDCWSLYCSITQLTSEQLDACVQSPPTNLDICYDSKECSSPNQQSRHHH